MTLSQKLTTDAHSQLPLPLVFPPKPGLFLYIATLSEQLLKLGCMRVGSKDINNVNHLLYISPSLAEIPSRK